MKSEEQLKKEQAEAQAQLEAMLSKSRPKNLRDGVSTGVSNILAGAVGGAGVAVLAPTMGLAAGLAHGGIIGGAFGAAAGGVVGALGAAGLIIGGAISGVTQVIRGIGAVPEAVMSPRQGKWWNEATHQWVYTDLSKTEVPESDDDILGNLQNELDKAGEPTAAHAGTVKDTYYYDLLEVDPKADPNVIKRKYYILARQYHPDKNDSTEAAEKFKEVAEAYQVLSDPLLRVKYDAEGRDALSGDKTSVNDDGRPDPSIVMAYLFGSDKFQNYFGRLATSTSAMLGDSTKLSVKDARTLQERRVARLALILDQKLEPWTREDYDLCKVQWQTEAEDLVTASYGWELLQALGMAYEVAALQFLGSTESGIGMPSISKWAEGQQARAKAKKAANKNQMQTMMATVDAMKVQMQFQDKFAKAQSEEEKQKLQAEMESATQSIMLQIIWTTVVVDITTTVHEVCQMVLFDQSVDKDIRERRAHGIKKLGEIFQGIPEPPVEGEKKSAREMFEEAALIATVETMKRKDEDTHRASFSS